MKNILYKYGDYYGKIAYFVELDKCDSSILLNFSDSSFYKRLCVVKISGDNYRTPVNFDKIIFKCEWCDDGTPIIISTGLFVNDYINILNNKRITPDVIKKGILIITPSDLFLYKSDDIKIKDLVIQLENETIIENDIYS